MRLYKGSALKPLYWHMQISNPFILHTDASGDGLGAVLYQDQDGQKRVIAYASRSLTKSERNYPVHKLEILALKWAITDKFHEYLYRIEFQVLTDNNPLTYVLTTAQQQRWMLQGLGGLLLCPTTPSASHTSLAKLNEMLMPCLELNGLSQ